MLISVVVCTFNRADLLTGVLQTLCEQTLKSSCYEIIVVDNNSRDNTRAVAEKFSQEYPNIKYFFERRQGLSHARNRGWREAKGRYVAYIDDECKVPNQWLAVAQKIIQRLSPAVFGGPYYGYHDSPRPNWWKESYESFVHAEKACVLSKGAYVRGGNMFIRRNLFEMLGGFDSNYGMTGQKLAYGEETELQKRIRAIYPDELIYYDSELYVLHLVRPEKMIIRWVLYSHFISGRYSFHLFQDNTPKASSLPRVRLFVQAVITALRFLVEFFLAILKRDRKRFPYLQNYLYENTFEHLQTLGFIYERYIHTT